jgi:hypothetical protein
VAFWNSRSMFATVVSYSKKLCQVRKSGAKQVVANALGTTPIDNPNSRIFDA